MQFLGVVMKTVARLRSALLASGALVLLLAPAAHSAYRVAGSVPIPTEVPHEIAFNAAAKRVYVGGSFARGPMSVVDVATPSAPSLSTTVASYGGVAYDPPTNRFFGSSGYAGDILTFDAATNALVASRNLGFCGGDFAVGPASAIYMISQCGAFNDPLHVIDGATGNLLSGPTGSGGVADRMLFNPATGRAYHDHYIAYGPCDRRTQIIGPAPSFAPGGDLLGYLRAINPVTNRLFGEDHGAPGCSGPDLLVRDGTSHAVLGTLPGAEGSLDTAGEVDTARNMLFVTDGAAGVVRIFDLTAGALVQTLSLGAGITPVGGLAVDSVTHRAYVAGYSGPSPVSGDSLYVIEPDGVPHACSDTDADGNVDDDGDGLCDNWETAGIDADGDGTVDLHLDDVNGDGTIAASEDADPNHKDMYLEIDYMAQHQPDPGAVADVIAAFAAGDVTNPDGTPGIRLHVQVDESAVAHNANLAFVPCTAPPPAGTPNYDAVKLAKFGTAAERAAGPSVLTAKRYAFRYALFAHDLLGIPGVSGCSELPGNDHVVSLGSWTSVGGHGVGTRAEQAGTLMHEFGHDLNLHHGGIDDVNCKPNYLSVMSYSRQIAGNPIAGRPLDYSRSALPTLNESSLSEPLGIGGVAGNVTAIGPAPVLVVAAGGAINWNRDADLTDVGVAANVNNLGGGCTGAGTSLVGFDDWANVKYDFQNTTDFADGIHLSVPDAPEITADEAAALAPTYAQLVLSDAPLSYHRLGEPGGSAMLDASGAGRNGSYQNGVVLGVPGAIAGTDTAARFDGRAAYGYVSSIPAPTQAYTLEAWANTTAPGSQTIVDHGGAGALYLKADRFCLRQTRTDVCWTSAPAAGTWYHVAGTWDAASGTASLYVDGVLRATRQVSDRPSGSSSLYIGYGQSARWFTGRLDDVAYYPTALSAARIQAHYDAR
jgi:hypothetical protein